MGAKGFIKVLNRLPDVGIESKGGGQILFVGGSTILQPSES